MAINFPDTPTNGDVFTVGTRSWTFQSTPSPGLWINTSPEISVVVNTQTASYTTVLTDAGKLIEMNVATANTLTLPPNASVAYPVGTSMDVIQYGAGQTTLTPGAGVSILANGSKLKLTGQYSGATVYYRGSNVWVANGDLSA